MTPEEEKSVENWLLLIQSWGFPPRVTQLRAMAEELLQAKNDYKELGANSTSGFLARHPTSIIMSHPREKGWGEGGDK